MTATDREWFEDEVFWERFAPIMFDPARWAEVPAVADGIERLAGVSPRGGRVLDLCCGTGRVAVELAARGYATTGVDITAAYLRAARESCDDEGVRVELVREDARRFVRPRFFDLAVNLYFSFGYFNDPADDSLLARNVRASLVDGGAFVIETVGKEIAMRDFIEGEWFDREGYTVLTEYAPVDSWAGLRNRWILIDGAERIERSFVQRLYSATELRRLLLDAGFSSVEIYGDWDGSPYDQKARVLITVARV
jgi:SAM-dependent methyltransferase